MKKKLLILAVTVGMMVISTCGQGVLIWNLANNGGPTATSGGLIYTNNPSTGEIGLFDGVNYNLGIEAYGGPSPSSLSSLGTFTAANDPKGYTGADLGKFQAGTAVSVPGVASGGTAYIQLKIWYDGPGGLYPSYAAALAGGDFWINWQWADQTFQNPTGSSSPPLPDQQLVGMPSMILGIPEPSTIALTGLGLAFVLLFHRRCRKVLLSAIVTCTAVSTTWGQGILIWNLANNGGPTATSGGLIYTNGPNGIGIFDGVNFNLGIEAYGGPSAVSLSSLGTFTSANDPKGYTGADYGKFQCGNAVTVPGVASGGTAFIQLRIWYDGPGGLFPNWSAAWNGGALVNSDWAYQTFQNPTGSSSPPLPDQQLVGMPSMILGVPEPSTIALLTLGAASVLIFRRNRPMKI